MAKLVIFLKCIIKKANKKNKAAFYSNKPAFYLRLKSLNSR